MRLYLRFGGHLSALEPGKNVLGRSSSCDVVIPDDIASRQHAEIDVQPNSVTIIDLGSRNGILVNDAPASELTTIQVGDRITIGGTELVLAERAERPSVAAVSLARAAARDSARDTETDATDVFGVLVKACGDALEGDDTEAAAFAANNLMLSAQAGAARGHPPNDSVFRVAAEFALMLADRTGDHDWLDKLFSMCTVHPIVFDPDVTDRIVNGVVRPSPEHVTDYLNAVGALPLSEVDTRNLERLQKLLGAR